MDAKTAIQQAKTTLGIEFGSTRIKAVLIDDDFQTIASGSFEWENQLVNGIWTYSLENIWSGLQTAYKELAAEVAEKYGEKLTTVGGIGFSAMMHGYMAFNKADELLVPFRTWRNAITGEAEEKLTDLFQYNIPQRWSIAHLYQAVLNKEEHVKEVSFFTTLAGYVHWQLTGEKVLGIGDASGMFPIDVQTKDYDKRMVNQFNALISPEALPWQLDELLPQVLTAGADAGKLTAAGAKLLDPTGTLQAGIPLCPPEGDAGTGMVATNSVAERTGNVSAGTSAFAMIVLENELSAVHPEIDMVTTPSGSLVGMVHTNNCTSEINAWMKLFREFADLTGLDIATDEMFAKLFNAALEGDEECGGMLSYGYYSGENITKMPEGRPLFVRSPESRFTLANFMRLHLFTAFGAMKIGMDILQKEENVQIDSIVGHGGIFKTPVVGQQVLAAVMNAPVTVMETAGEGGAWGIALLAAYLINKEADESLDSYLNERVFAGDKGSTIVPEARDVAGFDEYVKRYAAGLPIEKAAIEHLI
ncbi:xylulokinase [Candidatus Enterococcus leclercqii]|uniref:xylulokinase n=1 Tax=Candidatus Enterococcus leclercqii TaxID=1857218 RepID=UPI00137A9577|nr:FGGY-family carbohydrate kinase [Enterococcus sp. CU9D]